MSPHVRIHPWHTGADEFNNDKLLQTYSPEISKTLSVIEKHKPRIHSAEGSWTRGFLFGRQLMMVCGRLPLEMTHERKNNAHDAFFCFYLPAREGKLWQKPGWRHEHAYDELSRFLVYFLICYNDKDADVKIWSKRWTNFACVSRKSVTSSQQHAVEKKESGDISNIVHHFQDKSEVPRGREI